MLALAIDPSDPSVVYAGAFWEAGVFKTTNGGRTWRSVSSGLGNRAPPRPERDVFALAIDPARSRTQVTFGPSSSLHLSRAAVYARAHAEEVLEQAPGVWRASFRLGGNERA